MNVHGTSSWSLHPGGWGSAPGGWGLAHLVCVHVAVDPVDAHWRALLPAGQLIQRHHAPRPKALGKSI